MKKVVLLGSTGSIGTSTVKVVQDLPNHLKLVGLAAGNNADLLIQQSLAHQPEAVCIQTPEKTAAIREQLGSKTKVYSGEEGLIELATLSSADIVLISIVGTA